MWHFETLRVHGTGRGAVAPWQNLGLWRNFGVWGADRILERRRSGTMKQRVYSLIHHKNRFAVANLLRQIDNIDGSASYLSIQLQNRRELPLLVWIVNRNIDSKLAKAAHGIWLPGQYNSTLSSLNALDRKEKCGSPQSITLNSSLIVEQNSGPDTTTFGIKQGRLEGPYSQGGIYAYMEIIIVYCNMYMIVINHHSK